ncbi:Sulfatase modifying factor 1 (fragment) [Candidatus Terasakiella magnetica]
MRLPIMTITAVVLWFSALPAQAACSLDDSLTLAKAGYSKVEIECKDGGAPTGTDKSALGSSPETRSPGSVFRDCADCPEMVVIPPGSFMMGSEDEDSEVKPVHRVTISRPFAVGKYAVTQAEWEAVMGSNPSYFKGPHNPIEQVSWNEAQDFVNRLNAKVRSVVQVSTGGNGPYRLLTEAEWEYAARAGTTTKWYCGDSESCLSSVAVYAFNSNRRTAPVGSKSPNAFGLYDMHGNVWQGVQDCYVDSYAGAPSDGSAESASYCIRVYRGGSWGDPPRRLPSAFRSRYDPDYRFYTLGFRLARTL